MGRKVVDNNRVAAILDPGIKTWILGECTSRGISIGMLINSCLKWYKDATKSTDGVPVGVGYKLLQFSHQKDGSILVPDKITPDDLIKAAKVLEVMKGA